MGTGRNNRYFEKLERKIGTWDKDRTEGNKKEGKKAGGRMKEENIQERNKRKITNER